MPHLQKIHGGPIARKFHAPEVFIGKALKGAAVVNLLQVLDNAANGYTSGSAQRVKSFLFLNISLDAKCALIKMLKYQFKHQNLLFFIHSSEKIS